MSGRQGVAGWMPKDAIAAYRRVRTCGDPLRLENFGFKVYSKSDGDGIIAEIFRRIGTTNKTFIEFGCETGAENNTRLLLEQGWGGLWMESVSEYAGSVRWNARYALAEGRLTFLEAAVTREDVNDLFRSAGMKGEIDLLSLDIDGNDYHVFKAIRVVRPRVLVLEHNLVGCGLYSPNGFYVRDDLVRDRFKGPFTPEHLWNPLNYEMIRAYPVTSLAEPPDNGHEGGLALATTTLLSEQRNGFTR